uniref:Uncharacterized protein n=1 Tax=Herelleviridae sp. cttEB8 TaxID=2825832 RepID=A0A8S5P6S5_9CAUD|nr:MAG TPA: hypothetical protein [Herelleviridae sp. cttEB8]
MIDFHFLYSAFHGLVTVLRLHYRSSTGKSDGYQITAIYYSHISIGLYLISRSFFISFFI